MLEIHQWDQNVFNRLSLPNRIETIRVMVLGEGAESD
jgi:hypothetical protein